MELFLHMKPRLIVNLFWLSTNAQTLLAISTPKMSRASIPTNTVPISSTPNKKVWNYITQFVELNRFTNSPVAKIEKQRKEIHPRAAES